MGERSYYDCMDYYPLFADLRGRKCIVLGGDAPAERKTGGLLRAGARVTVVAKRISPALENQHNNGILQWQRQPLESTQLAGIWLVIAAADAKTNRRAARMAQAAGCFFNAVDDPQHSSFIAPALVDRAPLLVAISTGGAMPVLARRVRALLESLLPTSLGKVATFARRLRSHVRARSPSFTHRRSVWERFLDGSGAARAAAGDEAGAAREIDRLLKDAPSAGQVYLVGAGPGDPGLLTLRALQLLQQADLVLHDALVAKEILEFARRDAELIDVGKRANAHRMSQDQINRLLIDYARLGRTVIRLKGGDPLIFARGGEELQALRAAGVACTVVPGITAAAGCAASAGIPLTHRDHSHQVVLASAHHRCDFEHSEWRQLARSGQTLVFYMPVRQLAQVQRNLVNAGLSDATPFALVENGTRPEQRVVRGSLNQLAHRARQSMVHGPALLLVGEVTAITDSVRPAAVPSYQTALGSASPLAAVIK